MINCEENKLSWLDEYHYVYFVASGDNDRYYKVGYSQNVEQRIQAFPDRYKVSDPTILLTIKTASKKKAEMIELLLHKRLDDYRVNRINNVKVREWFLFKNEELITVIKKFKEAAADEGELTIFPEFEVYRQAPDVEVQFDKTVIIDELPPGFNHSSSVDTDVVIPNPATLTTEDDGVDVKYLWRPLKKLFSLVTPKAR
jgi:predicted GIY-YIG superfamily endonuclease